MFNKFFSKYQKLQDKFFVKQLDSFSFWLDKEIPVERRVYLMETRYVSKKVSKEKAYKNSPPSFLFCEPQNVEGVISKLCNEKDGNRRESNWVKIFSHSDYEIYEDTSTIKDDILPLRFGLSENEQKFALNLSRNSLELEIFKNKIEKNIFKRFDEKCDIDVTLWVNGKLRGSQIVFGFSFYEGIIEATKRAYNDDRFSKITKEEIKDTRIEIVILNSLQMPLLYKDVERNIPLHDKAYSVSVNEKIGFYLPATFNCVHFQSLYNLAELLFFEKISLEFSPKFFKNIFIGETCGYIESFNYKKSFELNGPIPQIYNSMDFKIYYNKTIDGFLRYLERIQDKNGNLLTKVNPLTGLAKNDDFIRLCFTTYSLFYYFNYKNDLRSRKIAERGFIYIKNVIKDRIFDSNSSKVMAYIYYARSAKLYGDDKEYQKSLMIINNLFDSCTFSPILYSQYVLLLLCENSFDKEKVEKLVSNVLSSFKDKEKRNEEIDLASYAELSKLLLETSVFSKDEDYFKKESERIVKWYLDKQNEDGSFYSSSYNTFSYTRGTGKILEVLIGLEGISKEKIEKAFVWSMNMQYNGENNYFIPKDFQSICNGGLRHDYFNQEIWIDGIGHLLIAFANLDKK